MKKKQCKDSRGRSQGVRRDAGEERALEMTLLQKTRSFQGTSRAVERFGVIRYIAVD